MPQPTSQHGTSSWGTHGKWPLHQLQQAGASPQESSVLGLLALLCHCLCILGNPEWLLVWANDDKSNLRREEHWKNHFLELLGPNLLFCTGSLSRYTPA